MSDNRPTGPVTATERAYDHMAFANDSRRCQDCKGIRSCRCYVSPTFPWIDTSADPVDALGVSMAEAMPRARVEKRHAQDAVSLLGRRGWSLIRTDRMAAPDETLASFRAWAVEDLAQTRAVKAGEPDASALLFAQESAFRRFCEEIDRLVAAR